MEFLFLINSEDSFAPLVKSLIGQSRGEVEENTATITFHSHQTLGNGVGTGPE